MQIHNFMLTPHSGATIAVFDANITDEVRVNGLVLRRSSDGQLRSFAPQLRGERVAHFAPSLAERITAAAVDVLRTATSAL